jgi:ankyrin repeat protein
MIYYFTEKLEALKLFTNMGLAVNVMDPENITPLHLAASRGVFYTVVVATIMSSLLSI